MGNDEKTPVAESNKKSPMKIALITTAVVIFITAIIYGYVEYEDSQKQRKQTQRLVLKPRVNDLYYLDFRLLSDNLRPNQKYRIAKVADITGDIITLAYGSVFYQTPRELTDAIRFGQLGFHDYYQERQINITFSEIRIMLADGAIYRARRPHKNMLDGHVISAEVQGEENKLYIYGTKENLLGEELLNSAHTDSKLKTAFDLFSKSSESGFDKGKVNLAQMYLVGLHVDKDVERALELFREASFQSYKPAIIKYALVCKQLVWCDVSDFYDDLAEGGVNIKIGREDDMLKRR